MVTETRNVWPLCGSVDKRLSEVCPSLRMRFSPALNWRTSGWPPGWQRVSHLRQIYWIKRGAIESQIQTKAAIVFGPDAAVDVRPDIQVGNFLVLAVQLDGNAHTRAKSRGVVTSDFFISDDNEGVGHAGYFLVAIEFGEHDLHLDRTEGLAFSSLFGLS